jgi:hypothetical protein
MSFYHPHNEGKISHEAELVAVVGGGVEPPKATFEDKVRLGWGWLLADGCDGRPRATAVKVVCGCGWEGRARPVTQEDFDDPDKTSEAPYGEWAHHAEVELAKDLPEELSRALGAVEWQLNDLAGTSYEMSKKRKAGETEIGDVRPLAVLNAVKELRRIADDCERDAVRQARSDFSWEEIGRALGITKQSAHERLRHWDPQS